MSENGYAFAVASVRTKENELLSPSFMSQLLESDYDECVRLLADKGVIPRDADDPAAALSGYMKDTWEFLSSIAPDMSKLNFLIVKNDFHNLKAILKSMVANVDCREFFLEPCALDPEDLYSAVKEKKFDSLPGWISGPAENGYSLITSTLDGQLLDVYLDARSFAAMRDFARASGSEYSSELTELQIALADIKVALRLSRGSVSENLVSRAFCECESLDTDELARAVLKGRGEVVAYIGTTDHAQLLNSLETSAAEFEKACDNMIVEKLSKSKYYSLSEEPLTAYYYARENECRLLRIILSCKHLGLEKGKITERMRELYV